VWPGHYSFGPHTGAVCKTVGFSICVARAVGEERLGFRVRVECGCDRCPVRERRPRYLSRSLAWPGRTWREIRSGWVGIAQKTGFGLVAPLSSHSRSRAVLEQK
jgi:hypothetical protein